MNNENIVNPFLNLIKRYSTDLSDLYNEYSCVYVICNKTNESIDTCIYNYYINLNKFDEIKKKLIIIKTNISILKNKNHLYKLIILPQNLLEEINVFSYKLNEKNICFLMLNINLENVQLYLSQYEKRNGLEDVYKLITMNTYFNSTNIHDKVIQLLNFEDSNYWTYDNRCNINITDYFLNRKFNLSSTIMKEIGCYLSSINKTNEYTDPSKILTQGKFKYKVFNEKNITKDEINLLFEILDEKEKFILLCNLIVSKRYCHLALNNIFVLKLMKPIMTKYCELFRYLIGYAWVKFYFDESIKKTFTLYDDDFIFTINTACELPNFPVLTSNPKLNPYIPLLVNDEILKPNENIGSVYDFINNNLNNNICNLDEFKIRLNIFATNNPKYNIFEFINWEKDKIAICGSIMAACIQKYHPLLQLFTTYNSTEEKLARFYNEYYGLADIDIMFLTDDIFEYMQRVHTFYNQIVVNICNIYHPYAEVSHTKLISDKVAYLFIDEEYVLKMFNNSPSTVEEVKKTIDEYETKKYFYKLFESELEKLKKDRLQQFKQEIYEKYPDYFNFDDINWKVRFYKNNPDIEKPNKIIINYKYKIKSPHINHQLELFSVKYKDFFATVQTFHLPCVRAYYNGSNVFMTPSCISAHLTFINIDYKYFAGSRDPIDIINKYRMRGFGTFLNETEKIILLKYSKYNLYWNNLYNIENNVLSSINGFLNPNHKIYHPRTFNSEYYYDAFPIDLTEPYYLNDEFRQPILKTLNDFYKELKRRNTNSVSVEILRNMQTINSNGSINKLNKWVIEACWNINENIVNPTNNTNLENLNKKYFLNNKKYDLSGNYTLNIKNSNSGNKIKNNFTPENIMDIHV